MLNFILSIHYESFALKYITYAFAHTYRSVMCACETGRPSINIEFLPKMIQLSDQFAQAHRNSKGTLDLVYYTWITRSSTIKFAIPAKKYKDKTFNLWIIFYVSIVT